MESFEGLGALREARPGIPVVVVSGSDNQETVRRAIATGAHGFIPKTLNAKVLLGALNLVMSGGVYLPPTLLGEADAAPAPETDPRPDGPKLTPRQREVLTSLVQGRSNEGNRARTRRRRGHREAARGGADAGPRRQQPDPGGAQGGRARPGSQPLRRNLNDGPAPPAAQRRGSSTSALPTVATPPSWLVPVMSSETTPRSASFPATVAP